MTIVLNTTLDSAADDESKFFKLLIINFYDY